MIPKSLFCLSFIFSCQVLMSQSNQPNYFLLKGKVSNRTESSSTFYKTGFFDTEKIVVIHNDDGTFNQKVPIEGTQDLSFIDGIYIYVQPNDTIEINWDEKNVEKTIEVKSPSIMRNKDYQLNLKIWKDFREAEKLLFLRLANEKDAEEFEKFKWINDQFNRQLKLGISNRGMTTNKFVYQIYYKHIALLMENNLIKSRTLSLDDKILSSNDLEVIKRYLPETFSYADLNNRVFYMSPIYRDFIVGYLELSGKILTAGPITNSEVLRNSYGELVPMPYTLTRYYNGKNDINTYTPIWDGYYLGLSQIHQIPIRDWYITKIIFHAFKSYDFEEAESVLTDFLPKCETTVYKDTLNAFYSYIKRFKQGNSAPEFKLKDESGKFVSLQDFKGYIVYLNFWGVHCTSSNRDMKAFYPRLIEKYKGKNVVFINICIDENEVNWKKALSKYNLNCVNLFAEGGSESQVAIDYYFSAPPTYVLIDKHGKILDYNPPHPFQPQIDAIIDKSLIDN